MGFRNPFRIQVDENDVAYVSDYSPDAQTPQRVARPGGHRPLRDRAQAVQLRLADVLQARPRVLPVELPRVRARHHHGGHAAATARRSCTSATARRSATTRCGTSRAARSVEPGLRRGAAGHQPGHLVLVPRQQHRGAARHAVPGATTRRRRARSRPGSTTECPRLFPELYTGGVGPHGMTKYNYDPANPNPKKFPPYYDDSVIFGEWTQDTLREVKLDDQNRILKINGFLDCGSRANAAAGTFLFECDNPMDLQFGCRRRVLPADLRQRVQRHQPGRRHVQVGVRQGQARRRRPC